MFVYLVILEPRERLRGEYEPVVPGSALHDAQVVDGHVALADHLVAKLAPRLLGVLGRVLGAGKGERVPRSGLPLF